MPLVCLKSTKKVFMQFIDIKYNDEYVIAQLNRGKANVLNLQFVEEICEAIQSFKEDPKIRGVIFTGKDHFFSAGLDVIELYGYDRPKMDTFHKAFGKMVIELSKFPKPFIAAITGHAPAGGTVIAQACDYRVMADDPKYRLGLNEIAVNVALSEDIINAYKFWLGEGVATRYLLQGKLMNAQEAIQIGLIDECCPLEEVLPKAELQMQAYLKADSTLFQSIKAKSRKPWWDQLGKNPNELEEVSRIWWTPAMRARMKGFVDSLTSKKQ